MGYIIRDDDVDRPRPSKKKFRDGGKTWTNADVQSNPGWQPFGRIERGYDVYSFFLLCPLYMFFFVYRIISYMFHADRTKIRTSSNIAVSGYFLRLTMDGNIRVIYTSIWKPNGLYIYAITLLATNLSIPCLLGCIISYLYVSLPLGQNQPSLAPLLFFPVNVPSPRHFWGSTVLRTAVLRFLLSSSSSPTFS